MKHNCFLIRLLSAIVALGILIPISSLPSSGVALSEMHTTASPICRLTGTLDLGESEDPRCPLFGQDSQAVNVKLSVPAAASDGSLQLSYTDAAGINAFTGAVLDGETLWTTTTLKGGQNVFELTNTSGAGGPSLDYEIWVYPLETAPYTWEGQSLGAGTWRSHIRLNFPNSGLYTFTSLASAGRYQFAVDSDYALETVESGGAVSLYVAAGTHDLTIWPDDAPPTTTWSLAITGPGATTDTLPYTAGGGEIGGAANPFDEEWIPVYLSAPATANFTIEVGGDNTDSLTVELYAGVPATPFQTVSDIQGGETLGWTSDLSQALTLIRILANTATAPLTYTLNIVTSPTVVGSTVAAWTGASLGVGSNNTEVRFQTSVAGLYDIDYGVSAGRYQFIVNSEFTVNSGFLQKTVEEAGTVQTYLGAGEHTVTVIQDLNAALTAWTLDIGYLSAPPDSLPYGREGGHLGGAGNAFGEEWLPAFMFGNTPVNVRLDLHGDLDDGLQVRVRPGVAAAAAYTSPIVYGGESFWWTQDLSNGLNEFQLVAEAGNTAPLDYTLTVEPVNVPPDNWSGIAKAGAGNAVVRLNVPTSGTYHVKLESDHGFAQVVVDDQPGVTHLTALPTGHMTEFDVPLTAGAHTFKILQTGPELTTTWSLDVAAVVADATIGRFAGTLDPDEIIEPIFPVSGQTEKGINFRLDLPEVAGDGDLTLTITDSLGDTAFTGTALDGETVWGTAVLQPGNNTFRLMNGSVALSYELTLYEITSTPFDWSGISLDDGGWNSQVTVNFPAGGLYDLDFGLPEGRLQFTVSDDLIRKTAETTGTVRYYIPAGDHLITILPDRDTDTAWNMDIVAAGLTYDVLPYTQSGGVLGQEFTEEWLSLNLAAQQPTNFVLTLPDTILSTDSLNVYLYAGFDPVPVLTITNVYVGERLWWTTDLPAGLSRVQLVTEAGSQIEYHLELRAKPTLPAAWDGVSFDIGNHSQLRFEVATAGLYDFSYEAATGRYQAVVDAGNDETLRKTVETDGTTRLYLEAGTHTLTLVQDPAAGADWELAIAPAGQIYDTLPYTQVGGELGGTGNTFSQDLLPLNLMAAGPANIELTLDGDSADGLQVYLYDDITASPIYTTALIYGGETVWWTADFASGANWVRLAAPGSNTAELSYTVTLHPLPTAVTNTPVSWDGRSIGAGMNSHVWLKTPVAGTYHVEMNVREGFATLDIDQMPATPRLMSAFMEFDVQLEEGTYLFTILQNATRPVNTWVTTVTLTTTPAPLVTSLDPTSIVNSADRTVTIYGANFWEEAEVSLDAQEMTTVSRIDTNTLEVTVPAGTPAGVYDVTVTNPDGQSATLPNALTVSNPAPTLTSVSPSPIANDVDRTVTLTGSYFQSGAEVALNDDAVASVTFVDAGTLTIIVPAGTATGVYDVTVTNPDDQSDTLPNALTVDNPPPTLTALSRSLIANDVDRTVTLTGSYFQSGAEVTLNDIPVASVTFVDAGTLTIIVPAGTAAGIYDVTVTNPDDQSDTLTAALTIVEQTYHVFLPLVTMQAAP